MRLIAACLVFALPVATLSCAVPAAQTAIDGCEDGYDAGFQDGYAQGMAGCLGATVGEVDDPIAFGDECAYDVWYQYCFTDGYCTGVNAGAKAGDCSDDLSCDAGRAPDPYTCGSL